MKAGQYFIESEMKMKIEDVDIMNVDLKKMSKQEVLKYARKCTKIWLALWKHYGHQRHLITRKWSNKSDLAHAEIMRRNAEEMDLI